MRPDELHEKAPERRGHRAPSSACSARRGRDEKIKVRGIDDLMVFRARCCNPIRGEKIVGYITRGKGVSVHSATCPNVVNLLYDPERRIDVEWDKAERPLAVHGAAEHRGRGSARHPRGVSARIADINTNIKDVEANVGDDHRRASR